VYKKRSIFHIQMKDYLILALSLNQQILRIWEINNVNLINCAYNRNIMPDTMHLTSPVGEYVMRLNHALYPLAGSHVFYLSPYNLWVA
jgi:hypothetical protein